MPRARVTASFSLPSAAAPLPVAVRLAGDCRGVATSLALPADAAGAAVLLALPAQVAGLTAHYRLPTSGSRLVRRVDFPAAAVRAAASLALSAAAWPRRQALRLPAVATPITAAVRLPSELAAVRQAVRLPAAVVPLVVRVVLPAAAQGVHQSVRLESWAVRLLASLLIVSSVDELAPPDDPYLPSDPVIPPPPPPVTGGVVLPTGSIYIEGEVSVSVFGQTLDCVSITLSTGRESWGWLASISCASSAGLALVEAAEKAGESLVVEVNGYRWLIALNDWSDTASHPATGLSINGRSLSAELAAPTAKPRDRVVSTSRTVRQIAADELGGTGWTLDWQAPSWTVPANVFAYQGRTPIEVVMMLATSAGAVVVTEMEAKTLRVVSRYPVKPWQTAATAPDYSLTGDVLFSYDCKRTAPACYTAVVVAGSGASGLYAKVRRAGVAEKLAPSVADPLIVHADAARARGVAELAASYVDKAVSLSMPLGAGVVPLMLPGKTLAVSYPALWRGAVDAVQINVNASGDAVTVTQSLEVQRYGS